MGAPSLSLIKCGLALSTPPVDSSQELLRKCTSLFPYHLSFLGTRRLGVSCSVNGWVPDSKGRGGVIDKGVVLGAGFLFRPSGVSGRIRLDFLWSMQVPRSFHYHCGPRCTLLIGAAAVLEQAIDSNHYSFLSRYGPSEGLAHKNRPIGDYSRLDIRMAEAILNSTVSPHQESQQVIIHWGFTHSVIGNWSISSENLGV